MKRQWAEVKMDARPVGQMTGLAMVEENPRRQMIRRDRQLGVFVVVVVVVAAAEEEQKPLPLVAVVVKGEGR
jgi:Na+-transporting methylmalonyl-CoA/oxaloacetate decarboxylase beta subunit